MKKYLAFLAVLIIVSVLVSLVHEHYADNSGKDSCHDTLAVSPKNDPNSKTNTAKPDDKAERAWEVGYLFFGWPNGITIWALIFTMIAIAEQTNATKDPTNAAYGSLTFAEAQLELTREKERARLDVNVKGTRLEVEVAQEHLLHLIATISIRNIGVNKAYIRRTSGTLITKLGNESLESKNDSSLDIPEQVIEPDKPFIPIKVYFFPASTTATFAECLEKGTFSLHFFGFIEYSTLGLCWRKEFGYDWNVLDRHDALGLAGLYGLSDPYPNSPRPDRERISYGYWSANEEKEKPEYPISCESEGENPI